MSGSSRFEGITLVVAVRFAINHDVSGQYVSALVQETITYLKLPYGKLVHEMSIPELVSRDEVEGKYR
jgi:hypothetical protein